MDIHKISVRPDCTLEGVAQVEAAAKAIALSAVNALEIATSDTISDGKSISAGTLIVALTGEMANLMACIDAASAADIFDLMAGSIRNGRAPDAATCQRMFKAQHALAIAETTLRAKQSNRGNA